MSVSFQKIGSRFDDIACDGGGLGGPPPSLPTIEQNDGDYPAHIIEALTAIRDDLYSYRLLASNCIGWDDYQPGGELVETVFGSASTHGISNKDLMLIEDGTVITVYDYINDFLICLDKVAPEIVVSPPLVMSVEFPVDLIDGDWILSTSLIPTIPLSMDSVLPKRYIYTDPGDEVLLMSFDYVQDDTTSDAINPDGFYILTCAYCTKDDGENYRVGYTSFRAEVNDEAGWGLRVVGLSEISPN